MAMTGKQKAATGGVLAIIIGAIGLAEGGYVNDPNDPGGETNWGCTIATARAGGYDGPMRAMPKSECVRILQEQFVYGPGYGPIVELEPVLAWEIIDTGVNAGPGRASPWFQRSLNLFSRDGRDYPKVMVDGQVGPATIEAYKALQRKRGKRKACELMVKAADGYQIAHYTRLCERSSRLATFCVGWIDHRIDNAPIEHCGTGDVR